MDMASKYIILTAFAAMVRGGVIGPAAFVAPAPVLASDATVDPNPAYSFAYDVQDALTGDSKSQVESRANGVVRGQYTVADPDGTRRIVDYYADPVHGFNAVVRRGPQALVARSAAPVVAARAVPVAAPAVAPVFARTSVPAPAVFPSPLLARTAVAAPAVYPQGPVARLASPFVSPPLASPYSLAPALF